MLPVQVHGVPARDQRVDFFRGVALFMIFVDHVIGDPLSRLTYKNFGLSDAAEIFVFLSGVSCGIVYSGVLTRRGWPRLLVAITRRTALIYAYYVLSSIAIILLLKTAAGSIEHANVFNHSFLVLREDFISTIWSTLLMRSPPDLPGILVLYILLTLIVIPLFLIGATRSAVLTLAASGLIWTISQIYPQMAPRLADHSYFNPFAWQFLFSIGMFVGLRRNSDWEGLRSAKIFKWLLVTAWAIVVISFLYQRLPFLSSKLQLDLDWLCIADITRVNMKENLNAVRLLHFLSVVLLVGTYVASNNSIFKWAGAVAIIRVGRSSLEVFSMSAILSTIFSMIFIARHPSVFQRVVLDGIAMLLMGLTAAALMKFRYKARATH